MGMNGYTGPHYPNASSAGVIFGQANCTAGCLFDIESDAQELEDLSTSMPDKVTELLTRLEEIEATAWSPDRGTVQQSTCDLFRSHYSGFYGPFADLSGAVNVAMK